MIEFFAHAGVTAVAVAGVIAVVGAVIAGIALAIKTARQKKKKAAGVTAATS